MNAYFNLYDWVTWLISVVVSINEYLFLVIIASDRSVELFGVQCPGGTFCSVWGRFMALVRLRNIK